jgi:hypothetical protein
MPDLLNTLANNLVHATITNIAPNYMAPGPSRFQKGFSQESEGSPRLYGPGAAPVMSRGNGKIGLK